MIGLKSKFAYFCKVWYIVDIELTLIYVLNQLILSPFYINKRDQYDRVGQEPIIVEACIPHHIRTRIKE